MYPALPAHTVKFVVSVRRSGLVLESGSCVVFGSPLFAELRVRCVLSQTWAFHPFLKHEVWVVPAAGQLSLF